MKKQEKNKAVPGKKTETQSAGKPLLERQYFFEFLVFCFSFLLFAYSIGNDYTLDDELVTINHRLTSKGISAIPEIFASPYYQDASGYAYEYRPIVLVSFAIEHDLTGDNPHWSHFWNILLYSLACVLLFKTLRTLFRHYSVLIPLLVTLLFAAHPAHTEVVCSIKNRDEILGLIFSLLALHFALVSVRGRLWAFIPVPIFFVLALLSKATFATFALIIPLAVFLFEDFSFAGFLFIVTSLSLPLLTIVNVGDTMTRLFALIAAIAASCILYIYKYFPIAKDNFRLLWSRLSQPGTFSWRGHEPVETNSGDFIRQVTAQFSSIDLKILGVHILLFSAYIASAYYNIYYLQLLLSLGWVLFIFEKNTSRNWIAYFFVYAVIVFKLYYLGVYKEHYALDFFLYIAGFYLIYGGRHLFIPSLLSFLSIFVFYILTPGNGAGFLVPIACLFILYLMRFRWGWIIAIAFFAIPVVTDLGDIPHLTLGIAVSLVFNTIVAAFLFAIYFKKFQWNIAKAFLVVALLGVSLIDWQHRHDELLVHNSVSRINNTEIKVSPKTENRPILYVENVIDSKTPIAIKAGTSLEILLHYLIKTVAPYPLSYYYGFSFIKPMQVTSAIPLISLVLHLILLCAGLLLYKKNKLVCFGILLYLASISIYSNYFATAPGMIADRFILIPSLGFIIVLVSGLLWAFKVNISPAHREWLTAYPKPVKYIFVFILSCYSVLTVSRNLDWKDYLTLFEHDVKYVDNSAQAHNLLAVRLMKTSYDEGVAPADQLERRKKAAIHFGRAIEIYPPFFNATYDLGRTYQILGNADSAVFYYKKALVLDSSFTPAAASAGDILMSQNKPAEAILLYETSVRQFPKEFAGYERLSNAFFLAKDYNQSISVLKKASEEIPQNNQPFIAIAKVYHNINKDDSTRYWLQRAIDVNPADQQPRALLQSLGPK